MVADHPDGRRQGDPRVPPRRPPRRDPGGDRASGDGVTPAELRTDLDRIRSRGYAINRGQDISGIYAIGMPVVLDEVAGSLSLASPSRDLVDDGRDAALEALSRAVERVERRLSEREVASGPGSSSR
ncbi:IclR family transcriptional regulator domain-containing protein [Halobellus sp. EA9]|uniref:IclR family transcriptional regulator domain-containing protein n=1 Tax=Halobellus sp. EA9 TaxID=3421647 RepID=UPI003EBE1739